MIDALEKPGPHRPTSLAVPVLQNVSRQGATVLVSRGGLLVLGLASNILLSRILGPTGLGK
jgi:O-antigen/teichoic acid export membrane protein